MASEGETPFHFSFKVVMVGDAHVGKTSLLLGSNTQRMAGDTNVGINFRIRYYEADGMTYRVEYWDCPGSERHSPLTSRYAAGSTAAIFVFDVTNRLSFEHIETWIQEVNKTANVLKVLVGNKCDGTSGPRVVSSEEAEALAEHHCMSYFEASASSGVGVQEMLEHLLQLVVASLPSPAEPMLLLKKGIKIGKALLSDHSYRDSLFLNENAVPISSILNEDEGGSGDAAGVVGVGGTRGRSNIAKLFPDAGLV